MSSWWGLKRPEITFLFQLAIRLDKRLRKGGVVAADMGYEIGDVRLQISDVRYQTLDMRSEKVALMVR
jgi:hypothetical protein